MRVMFNNSQRVFYKIIMILFTVSPNFELKVCTVACENPELNKHIIST